MFFNENHIAISSLYLLITKAFVRKFVATMRIHRKFFMYLKEKISINSNNDFLYLAHYIKNSNKANK